MRTSYKRRGLRCAYLACSGKGRHLLLTLQRGCKKAAKQVPMGVLDQNDERTAVAYARIQRRQAITVYRVLIHQLQLSEHMSQAHSTQHVRWLAHTHTHTHTGTVENAEVCVRWKRLKRRRVPQLVSLLEQLEQRFLCVGPGQQRVRRVGLQGAKHAVVGSVHVQACSCCWAAGAGHTCHRNGHWNRIGTGVGRRGGGRRIRGTLELPGQLFIFLVLLFVQALDDVRFNRIFRKLP